MVYCPESKHAHATQSPVRKELEPQGKTEPDDAKAEDQLSVTDVATIPSDNESSAAVSDSSEEEFLVPESEESQEQHYTIRYDDTGYSYESIIGPYLKGAKEITIEDPYIRLPYQIQNFVRFCETIIKLSLIKKINLVTGYDDSNNEIEIRDKLGELKQSLLEIDAVLNIKLNPHPHDREIRLITVG